MGAITQHTHKNIFVLTQERFLSMSDKLLEVDFFVIDEFYKLSITTEGDRATRLNQAFLLLCKTKAQFYLLGPSIGEIPPEVKEKTGCSFLIEDFQTVAIELHLESKKPTKIEALVNLLDKIDGQTMIYCSSPTSTRKVLKEYLNLREIELSKDEEIIEAAKWTAKNYHDDWLVSIALKHGIGIHHGRLPRSLGRFMIRAFEENKLKILLCTSTLIEGVNTAAKNVIIYDNKLSNKSLNFFTFNNIRGRSGRMFKHFIGHVYIFDKPPQEELPFVDFPALNPTEDTPSSLLIHMPMESLPDGIKTKVNQLIQQDILPIEILKKLSGIEPEFLLDAANYLKGLSIQELMEFSWASSNPKYDNIKSTSEVIWAQLGGKSSAGQADLRSPAHMTKWIFDLYVSKSVSKFRKMKIQELINYNKTPDEAVENVLAFLRGWASFNYPKYLVALSEIANHVLTKQGQKGCNYIAFAASIEHLFQPNSFSSLEEYGLPTEISEKFITKRLFGKDDDLDVVVKRLRESELSAFGEGIFERRIIEDFQSGIGRKLKVH